MVCDPSLAKLGSQPLNIHVKLSLWFALLINKGRDTFPSSLLIRVLRTSTGEQVVVAMRLTAYDTATWVGKVPFMAKRLRQIA